MHIYLWTALRIMVFGLTPLHIWSTFSSHVARCRRPRFDTTSFTQEGGEKIKHRTGGSNIEESKKPKLTEMSAFFAVFYSF